MIVILDGILFCAFTSVRESRVMDEKYQMGASWSMRGELRVLICKYFVQKLLYIKASFPKSSLPRYSRRSLPPQPLSRTQ